MAAAGVAKVFDVLIASSGIAGLALAACLGTNPITRGLRVALLPAEDEAFPYSGALALPLPEVPSPSVAALTPATIDLLRRAGIWSSINNCAALVGDAQVWDAAGEGFLRASAASVGQPVLGVVIEQHLLAAALVRELRRTPVQLLPRARIASLSLPPYQPTAQHGGGPLVGMQLADGQSLQARLLVGADGAASRVRELAQIRTQMQGEPDRRALMAIVHTLPPNSHTAHQRFLPDGALALLPVRGGMYSVVWHTKPRMAQQLEGRPGPEFAAAVNAALVGGPHYPPQPLLSSLLAGVTAPPVALAFHPPPAVAELAGPPRSQWLVQHHAGRYTRPRLALLGDAAHALPVASGQGVNLGLGDARVLAHALADAVEEGNDVGDAAMLEQCYEAPRHRANGAVLSAVDNACALFAPQEGPLPWVRSAGLDLLNASTTAKAALLRYAMWGA